MIVTIILIIDYYYFECVASVRKTRIQNELNQTFELYKPNKFKLKLNSFTS